MVHKVWILLLFPFFFFGINCNSNDSDYHHINFDNTTDSRVKTFIDSYFKTWSDQDMQAYRDHFHPQATIYFVDSKDRPVVQALSEFITGQIHSHQQADSPMKEYPLKSKVVQTAYGAQASVLWELKEGNETKQGYDYFNLYLVKDEWKIMNLVFHSIPSDVKP